MDIKNLLEVRKRIKSKKPRFIRQDFHKKVGLKKKWRRPKGLHSKLRLNIRGKRKPVSSGYRSPKKVRGLHKSGLQEKKVSSIKDLSCLDSKKHGIVISSTLGNRKRIVILKKAKDSDFKILNIRDPDGFIKGIEEKISEKKKVKREEKKAIKEKAAKKEKKLSDKVIEEDKKEIEKKEGDKLLAKRER